MKTIFSNRFILIFNLLFVIGGLHAQTGSVRGTLYEDDGVTTLIGANVYLKDNPSLGTVTEIDGTYLLDMIPTGPQVIVYSYTGFETKEESVNLTEGEVLILDHSLSMQGIEGVEAVVTAQAVGQSRAIRQQVNSESIVNIVSAARIQELPDVNAAEAISRLPGIALTRSGGEGQKVIIRGMSPKFSAITINGIRMPSNSGTDRSVDLSLISPELLNGIEVYKSPLPDMDAESIGGTVNLRLAKAPKELKLLAKVLGGYNDLNKDYGDYKAVFQASKRIFSDRLGVVAQGSVERFNRGADFINYDWRQGATDTSGLTQILGNRLRYEDRQQIRKRQNASLALDYDIGKSRFSFFGLYSRTAQERVSVQESYLPSEPAITFLGSHVDGQLTLSSFTLQAEHLVGKSSIDWTVSTSLSKGETPYNFEMLFENTRQVFDSDLNADGHPRTYYESATPDLATTYLRTANFMTSETEERTNTYVLNYKLPFTVSDNFKGYIKAGGKYITVTRSRDEDLLSEDFYYLGGSIGRNAIAASSNPLILLPENSDLISINSFTQDENNIDFINETGENIGLKASLDSDLMNQWYKDQKELLNENREVIVNRYSVKESLTAAYLMMKFDIGENLTIIPGLRYEYSDNEYHSGISSLNGRYGVNGFYTDTTTTQNYGELLPHLHIKFNILDWLDVRASYSTTMARPDFNYITPRSQINDNSLYIISGNPALKHAKANNIDLFITAYKSSFGLLSAGVFYKKIENISYPWRTNLYDQETADKYGWPTKKGYELRSYVNSGKSTVKGFEIDLQTNFRFLPPAFHGFVLNLNYARLFSTTESFFLTSETELVSQVPPIFITTYTNHVREVALPTQAPHIFNVSLGFDHKGFSSRISGTYQGVQASRYDSNKDFDQFIESFWRWDASIKQRFGEYFSVFVNINNFTNQQDIKFTRSEEYRNTIETYGATGNIGLQYKLH